MTQMQSGDDDVVSGGCDVVVELTLDHT